MSAALLLAAMLAVPGRLVVLPPGAMEGSAPGWIGAAVEETLARALQRAGIAAIATSDRRRAQAALGATWLVSGAWELGGTELRLSLRLLDARAGEASAPLAARGPLESLPRLIHELAWDVARATGLQPALTREELLREADVLPFEALRALGEGLVAREAPARVQGLRRALALFPGYDEATLALARLLADAGRFDEARQALARVPRGSRFGREALFLEGACLLGLARHAEADVVYAGLAAREPTAAVLANRAAARLRLASRASGAQALLRQALDAQPFAAELPFGLGWALLVEGDLEAAAFWLRGAVRYAPSDATGRLALSWALVASGRGEEAEEQWRAASALEPALATLRQPDLTRRFERTLLSENALLLDAARAADARAAREHQARGEALLAAGDPSLALAELERAVRQDPFAAQAHRLLARAHEARGEADKALAELRSALLCRDDPALRREIAERLRAFGREAEARRVLQEP